MMSEVTGAAPPLAARGAEKTFGNVAAEPSVVLLDEPTVGVDPQSRERIYEMLSGLQATGVAVVLTTHHLEEAERRCQRSVIIDHGIMVASGTLRELLASALSDNRSAVVAAVNDGGAAVAARIDELTRLGGASLQDVFIGLPGRELRD
ncbi:MAG: AAA family ATPase [Acidobacteria bacterium]|nr:AAA family ATPase [Acidobacteriota bacterium]